MADQMKVEWEAWQRVCAALKALSIDINKQDELAKAIRDWGEELAVLRQKQAENLTAWANA